MAVVVFEVPAGERWMVDRLGRHHRMLEPGRRLIVPLLDRVTARIPVDRQVMQWSERTWGLAVRGSLRFTVADPVKATESHVDGWPGLRHTLRRLVMDSVRGLARTLDDDPAPAELAEKARAWMRPVAAQWGIAVDEVTIDGIEPQPESPRMRTDLAARRPGPARRAARTAHASSGVRGRGRVPGTAGPSAQSRPCGAAVG